MVDEETPFWLALGRVEGLGVRGAHKLLERFASPAAAYHASLTELESSGVSPQVARAIFSQAGLKEAEKEIGEVEKLGGALVTYPSPDYPPLLKQID